MDNIFYQNIIFVPAVAFALAVVAKWMIVKFSSWEWNVSRALWSGGMPSVHSSVVVSLATAFAIKYWVQSDFFAIVMAFTVIIIYDAINVRFEAGLHAEAINKAMWEKRFKESLGHLPSEAFAGSLLGILVAIILSLF